MKKVIFIESVHEILHERLSTLGFQCENRYDNSRDEILSLMHEFEGLVLRSRIQVDKAFLEASPNLKFIARSGSGLENIDVKEAELRGIKVFSSPEGNRDAVGEHAIAMLLMLFNNLKRADTEVRNNIWRREENRGLELKGKTVAIIGYGVMGSGLAEKLSGFGCRILAHDLYKSGFANNQVEEVNLKVIFDEADIVSLHLPLTSETIHYANGDFFSRFKKNIYLINTARGKNVNTADLAESLRSGKVAGACLDVLEHEKSSLEGLENTSPDLVYLQQAENVILTPHIAGWTHESYYKLSGVLADKIELWLNQKV
ncbi:MAG: NAD(P)-dependent oxidoreductase [Flavobacteriales bacterium]